ncbi:MAG: phosphoglucosamine mutase [Gammaproteobacteria bacterium 28-57-27]|nr:MAG: phosphoglucosamine mutase [Gammaproteobacteria bacterium 28-57-27]
MKFFGTDGVRGRVGQWPMTPEVALKLGWAAGKVLAQSGTRKVVLGKDTRISGYMLESALEAGLIAAGVDVRLLGPMPTPAIAYLTRTLRASAGVVISASHNPFDDNGVKFFNEAGSKLSDTQEAAIEALMDSPLEVVAPERLGKAKRVEDAAGRYIESCKATLPLGSSLAGLHVVLDCAHGATYHVAPKVFAELGAQVESIGVMPDGFNINAHCGSTHPEQLRAAVLAHGADMGIAFDGDGDRVVMVDETGALLDGDDLLFAIVRDRVEQEGYSGGVVGTLMSNLGLELAIGKLGLPFQRANVGDRYVYEALRGQGWLYGGEASGHILCLDRAGTGDGIIAALQVVDAMRQRGEPLSALRQSIKKYPQLMLNVPLQEKVDLAALDRVWQCVAEFEKAFNGRGRIVLRASGTEPLVRVMVESGDAEMTRHVAETLAAVVKEVVDTH